MFVLGKGTDAKYQNIKHGCHNVYMLVIVEKPAHCQANTRMHIRYMYI